MAQQQTHMASAYKCIDKHTNIPSTEHTMRTQAHSLQVHCIFDYLLLVVGFLFPIATHRLSCSCPLLALSLCSVFAFFYCISFWFLFLRHIPFVCNLHTLFSLAITKSKVKRFVLLRILDWLLCDFIVIGVVAIDVAERATIAHRFVRAVVVFFDWSPCYQFRWLRPNHTKINPK